MIYERQTLAFAGLAQFLDFLETGDRFFRKRTRN
jgi:hypothetical protein